MEVCSQNTSDPRTVLLKVNGNRCNMSCVYCSELPKRFSPEQCTFDMYKVISLVGKLPRDAAIILHGGEPTLIGMQNILHLVQSIRNMGFAYTPSIQTNGFLDDEWVEFFAKNKDIIKLSVSMDGPKECNIFRRTGDRDASKAFETVDGFLHKIDAAKVDFRCIATINSASWKRGSGIVRYFMQFEHLQFLRLNPCFDIGQNGPMKWAVTPSEYLSCLKQVFDSMVELRTYKKFKLDPLMDMMDGLQSGKEARDFEFKCGKFSSIFPDGTVTSCDAMREVLQDVEIGEYMFDNFVQPPYVDDVLKKCRHCVHLGICRGGCPPLMVRYQAYDEKMLDDYCAYRVGIRQYILAAMKRRGL